MIPQNGGMKLDFKRLKHRRIQKGFTQEEVAKHIGIAPSSYAMYESGQRDPSTETLNLLSGLLECSADYLLGRVSKPYYEVFEDLPQELRDEGVKMLLLTKEAAKDGLTAEDLADVLEFVRMQKLKKK
jgi:transcriptional regulator with XRE-family HTH domain